MNRFDLETPRWKQKASEIDLILAKTKMKVNAFIIIFSRHDLRNPVNLSNVIARIHPLRRTKTKQSEYYRSSLPAGRQA
ncbi:MAG: hypothetical protein COT91_04880 [Candidatus Doudnabacteria bacterium CG10_big_fil_rev_8_21_14_0_10_41_10]|uniref:Uncharacterized protein n=1 Tax=Candidatus Doudnabacteria bacterium CG10_big_fil_rev_8_21_14_0_10_41_10 TaxID=1974551 RepID=A0A2H0VCD4_9BACT|nr:MAG: hypothetical protein COT91_04880 [Candidatus Doudnabacteria bacterium CG10_big_fil_rev_8_21_14_0_10_41_10]